MIIYGIQRHHVCIRTAMKPKQSIGIKTIFPCCPTSFSRIPPRFYSITGSDSNGGQSWPVWAAILAHRKNAIFLENLKLSRKHLGNLFVKNYPKILPSLPLSPLAKQQVLLKPDVFKRPKDTTSVGSLLPHTHIIHTPDCPTYIHKSHPHIPNIFYPFSISFICSFF